MHSDIPNTIERTVEINATAERVWSLVSTPGWFINDGDEMREHRIERMGDVCIVHDPQHGVFPFRIVSLDAPRYAAFRFEPAAIEGTEGNFPSTLIEFWIDPLPAGGVMLRMVESGFASLDGDVAKRRKEFDDNSNGWDVEIALAKRWAESQM